MKRVGGWDYRKLLGGALLVSMALLAPAHGQELLKAIEPGTGYSRMKQWAIDHRLVFENFTKDSLVISGEFQESGDTAPYAVRMLSRFCAGDDYAGREYNATLQQILDTRNPKAIAQIFQKHRQYVEALAGKPSDDGRFAGEYKLRRERTPDQKGVAVGFSSDKDTWELGLFSQEPYLTIQVVRSRDDLCK
jgi:hypothetical protein